MAFAKKKNSWRKLPVNKLHATALFFPFQNKFPDNVHLHIFNRDFKVRLLTLNSREIVFKKLCDNSCNSISEQFQMALILNIVLYFFDGKTF